MLKTGYHATSNINGIISTGVVYAARLPNVYLFTEAVDAQNYMKEFNYSNVVTVTYDSRDVERTWKPAYAKYGKVVKLGVACQATYVSSIVRSLANGNYSVALTGLSRMQDEIDRISK